MKGCGVAIVLATTCDARPDYFSSNPLDAVDSRRNPFDSRVSFTLGAITSGESIVNETPTPANPIPPFKTEEKLQRSTPKDFASRQSNAQLNSRAIIWCDEGHREDAQDARIFSKFTETAQNPANLVNPV